ncbi:uncharacterized protein LOC111087158 [Limulus polyphemus]|uniref:Uncharacterized protein LOC111087158 n=1 Tax=Limulus polyphemus TaxID=6850 RepID=A0ABM1SY27_LIMPO|nr:uncharacterized protein LOC111087158 [Limulus polyphemus]
MISTIVLQVMGLMDDFLDNTEFRFIIIILSVLGQVCVSLMSLIFLQNSKHGRKFLLGCIIWFVIILLSLASVTVMYEEVYFADIETYTAGLVKEVVAPCLTVFAGFYFLICAIHHYQAMGKKLTTTSDIILC